MDYADQAFLAESTRGAFVAEVYSGEAIVGWQGNIERQLDRMAKTYDAAGNRSYFDKLTTFLRSWRGRPLSGSINTEDLSVLLSATEQLAVDDWGLKNYFSCLRDSLRRLIASEEELPRGVSGPELDRQPSRSTLSQELPTEFGPENDQIKKPDEEQLPPVHK